MAIIRMTGMSVIRNGVVWYSDQDLNRSVWLRVRKAEDGRWEISELYFDAEERPLSTDDLRRVPLGKIEAFCNQPSTIALLEESLGDRPLSLEQAAREADHAAHAVNRSMQKRRQVSARLPEHKGTGEYGDDFYKRVATIYVALVERGIAPGPHIAEANNVPVTTARRWVRESRKRGFLAPGRAGRAG